MNNDMQDVVAALGHTGFYPPVGTVEDLGGEWLVCANGHRWNAVDPEAGCPKCNENAKHRLAGRPECSHPGCDIVVDCGQQAFDSGVRTCRRHWQEDQARIWTAGPVTLNAGPVVQAQYNPGLRWNGWLMPRIDAWSVMAVLTDIDDGDTEYGYDWEWLGDGSLKLEDRQWRREDPEHYQPEILPPDEDGLYDLGAGSWTWFEYAEEEGLT